MQLDAIKEVNSELDQLLEAEGLKSERPSADSIANTEAVGATGH